MKNFIKAVITLFKSVPTVQNISDVKFSNEENVTKGFFITESAFKSCPIDKEILKFIEEKFGYNILELNQGFYKSFKTVTELTPQKILANKLLHYMSTYGFENLGIFDQETVFIPNDVLELPADSKPIKLTIINSIGNISIFSRVEKMIMSGIALSDETLENLTTIIKYLNLKFDIDAVPNKELRIRLYDLLNILPKNPAEFLRYMIYKAIDSTLLIKSPETIGGVKNSSFDCDKFFTDYIAANGLEKLAEIFHRYKPLWLAFKQHSKFMKSTVNKMRKLADKYHKPLTPKILDTVTSSQKINVDELKRELEKVPVFKRISLANAILFRSAAPESIAYMIRNGKVFVEEYDKKFKLNYQTLLTIVESIVEVVRPNVEGRKIYLPENLIYAAPISEKKFIGEIPFGSAYTFDSQSVIVGVHWFNLPTERVDLDLHLNSTKRSIGWYNDFNNKNFIDTKNETIIFSGDMTDAPIDKGGATEAYFVGESLKDEMLMVNLNRYTYHEETIPYKLILGHVEDGKIDRKYLIDSHEIAFCLPNKIESGEMFIGFLNSDENGNKKFYFTAAETSRRIVARRDENALRTISALQTSLESCLKLKDILKDAGAIFEKDNDEEWDINLDPQVITKDTILNLFAKVSD
ncbi:MAG: hypothetical protein IKZ58_02645 [Selenomonadaceae bacterium]|nr:hypothetical protein [Selenomonadaceae bacterium]